MADADFDEIGNGTTQGYATISRAAAEMSREGKVRPIRTEYYSCGPGLSRDAAQYIATKNIVCVGMDVPFIDSMNEGFLQGASGAPADAPSDLPFFIHHHNLTQAGIYQVHNMHLDELAADEVYLSAIFILPLRVRGAANSAVRPVAIGRPYNVEGPATPRGDLIGHTAPDPASAGSAPERSAPSSSRGR
jgi:hypothetical protein